MTSTLPDPLVPSEVDLRGLEYMPFFGNHLFGSEFNARCSDAEWRAGVTLWWAAWNQVPAASLPNDDAALARLADLGRDVKGWRKVKARALHGFTECSDGRLYHRFLSQQALVAWEKRVKEREKKRKWREAKDGTGDRDKRNPEPGQERGQSAGQNRDRDRTEGGDGTADGKVRDVTGRDGTELQGSNTQSASNNTSTRGKTESARLPGESTPNPEHQAATLRGLVSVALREEGCDITTGNPLLTEWIDLGVTVTMAREALDRARLKKPKPERVPAKYLDPIMREVLEEAKRPAGVQRVNGNHGKPWFISTWNAIVAKGAEKNLNEADFDTPPDFRLAVLKAHGITFDDVRKAEADWKDAA